MICATDTSNRPGTVRRLLDLRLFVGRQRVSVYRAPLHGETRTASLPATLSSFLSLPSFDENSWRQSAARGTRRQWRNSPSMPTASTRTVGTSQQHVGLTDNGGTHRVRQAPVPLTTSSLQRATEQLPTAVL